MGNLFYESLENGSNNNNKFINYVVISLKDYEDMKRQIEALIEANKDLENKVTNMEDILIRCQLPVDLIREGKIKEVVRFENYEPITRDLSYMIKLNIAREDIP